MLSATCKKIIRQTRVGERMRTGVPLGCTGERKRGAQIMAQLITKASLRLTIQRNGD